MEKKYDKKEEEETREEKRNRFLVLLEDKLIDVGKMALKMGTTSFVKSKIREVEERIENNIEEKVSKIRDRFLQFLFLILGFLFVFYGGFLLLMEKVGLSEYSNIIFGGLFLFMFLIFKLKK